MPHSSRGGVDMDTTLQRTSVPWMQLVFLLLWFSLGCATFAFGQTPGFVWGWLGDRMVYAIDVSNNGADDALHVQLGLIWAALGLIWGARRIRTRFGGGDLLVYLLLLLLEGFFAFGLVDGMLLATVTVDRNVPLAVLYLAYAGLWAAWLYGVIHVFRTAVAVEHPVAAGTPEA